MWLTASDSRITKGRVDLTVIIGRYWLGKSSSNRKEISTVDILWLCLIFREFESQTASRQCSLQVFHVFNTNNELKLYFMTNLASSLYIRTTKYEVY